jgi:type IV secretory pathway ATPase VirB11/archaellum biosynthesis ATPase/intein/homing endonuclease
VTGSGDIWMLFLRYRNLFNWGLLALDEVKMIFKEGAPLYATEIERKQGEDILYVNFLTAPFVPSIADNPAIMARVIDLLIENPSVSRIVFVQQRNYHYPFEQVSLLAELARTYNFMVKQENILSLAKLSFFGDPKRTYEELSLLLILLKQSPFGCYLNLKRRISNLKNEVKNGEVESGGASNYLLFLERFLSMLEQTKLIKSNINKISEYPNSNREIYSIIFRPDILPNFTFTRLVAQLPSNAELVDQYEINSERDSVQVTILKRKNDSKFFYHIMPPEYALTEEQHMLLNLARNIITEHRPKAEEFTDPEKTRQVFFNVSKDLLGELAASKKISLSYKDLNKLARILVRYTIGFGLIEILLMDNKLQDIVINAPIALNPIFIRHEKYDECVTNIIPSFDDADSWAAKLRLQSGRPLDEANPVLDTDLVFSNARARVAAVKEPLSPSGIAYAFRRHRDEPWTLPLFIKNKMLNSFAAGLLSFIIDGNRTILVAGTRSSGKTSLLGSLMLEIMPKIRTLVIEDSVAGNNEIFIKQNGTFKKVAIGEFIDEQIKKNGFIDADGREKEFNLNNIEVFSVDKNGKVCLSKASKFIRHKTNKPLYEITTVSGKRIKVTGDHSLFGLDEKTILKEVKAAQIKEEGFIAIPYKLNFNNSLNNIDLLEHLEKLGEVFIEGEGVKNYMEKNRKELFSLAYAMGHKKSAISNWAKKNILPVKIFEKVKDKINNEELSIKSFGQSQKIPAKIVLDDLFLNFAGLWLADGCYDRSSVIISVMEEENKEVIRKIAERFNSFVRAHSDGFSSMVNSSLLKKVMQKVLELDGNSYTKNMPSWAHNLSDKQAGWLLKGYYSGDGCASDKEVLASSCSKELIGNMVSLLLRFNIVLRVSDLKKSRSTPYGKDNTISCRIGSLKDIKRFKENIGFLVKTKQDNLDKLCAKISTHDTSDIIPLSLEIKEELNKILGNNFNSNDYISREQNIGREHLKNMLQDVPEGITNFVDPLKAIISSDIFWDKVKSVKKIDGEGYVYDISVPEHENFICENIVAHNTLELPVDALRKLGYDILRMKVKSALVSTTTEIEAADGIRTSLRLGDSALIIGEVRSTEAKALYEAMRVGALANVVAGTIHGDSPYGVFDRVVNDLEVPPTSFKATDLIIIANPVKTPDGMHAIKRVMSVTEVRKHWNKDPTQEGGFVDLLRYNVEKDELEPTPELINGESEILKSIASNVKGWAGDWNAIYDNIILRGQIKQEIVDAASRLDKPELLESGFNCLSNNAFHAISEKIRQEKGSIDCEIVFAEWKDWFYGQLREL